MNALGRTEFYHFMLDDADPSSHIQEAPICHPATTETRQQPAGALGWAVLTVPAKMTPGGSHVELKIKPAAHLTHTTPQADQPPWTLTSRVVRATTVDYLSSIGPNSTINPPTKAEISQFNKAANMTPRSSLLSRGSVTSTAVVHTTTL